MKIIVKDNHDLNLHLRFPTGLILNRTLAYFLFPKAAKDYGVTISGKQAIALVNAIKDYKRKHPNWKIVEVESASGEIVTIQF